MSEDGESKEGTYEDFLQQTIFPNLENGRANWDKPHTQKVVSYVKKLVSAYPDLKLDKDVLIIAAYAHDWGYADLFNGGQKLTWEKVKENKYAHMQIGAEKISTLLQKPLFNFLSEEQKQRIVFLVATHDDIEKLDSNDQFILMEADTLGGLDIDQISESDFDPESNRKYMTKVSERRFPKFITEYGKAMFRELFEKRSNLYQAQVKSTSLPQAY